MSLHDALRDTQAAVAQQAGALQQVQTPGLIHNVTGLEHKVAALQDEVATLWDTIKHLNDMLRRQDLRIAELEALEGYGWRAPPVHTSPTLAISHESSSWSLSPKAKAPTPA